MGDETKAQRATRHERMILRMLLEGTTLEAIGRFFGVSKQRIHQISKDIPGVPPRRRGRRKNIQ